MLASVDLFCQKTGQENRNKGIKTLYVTLTITDKQADRNTVAYRHSHSANCTPTQTILQHSHSYSDTQAITSTPTNKRDTNLFSNTPTNLVSHTPPFSLQHTRTYKTLTDSHSRKAHKNIKLFFFWFRFNINPVSQYKKMDIFKLYQWSKFILFCKRLVWTMNHLQTNFLKMIPTTS